jgi:Tol biopolymer transport system component
LPAVISAVIVGALAAAAAWSLKPPPPPPASPSAPVARFSVKLPQGQRFSGLGRHVLAISPDGRSIAYVADNRIYIRQLGALDSTPLTGTDSSTGQGVTTPVFSPDSRSIAFYSLSDGALKRLSLSGGGAVILCPADNPYGMSWGTDGILFSQSSRDGRGVMKVSASGGKAQMIVSLKEDEVAEGPQMLPDGETVLFTLASSIAANDRWDKAQVVAQSVKSGARRIVIDGGSDGRYLPTGHVAYALSGTVYAVPFDLRTLTTTGGAVPILEGVRRAAGGTTGMADFSVSTNGALVYVPGPVSAATANVEFTLADRKGALTRIRLAPGPYQVPRASHDGTRVAFGSDDGKDAFIAVYDLSGASAMRRVTFGGKDRFPIWSADGRRVTYQSGREGDLGIFWQAADGTGAPERLTRPGTGEAHVPQSWSPAGDVLLFDVAKGSDVSLWQLSLKDRRITPFGGVRSSNPTSAVFSPDGLWVAYATTEERVTNIYVQPFPPTGVKHQLVRGQSGSPHHPIWTPDGRELIYNPAPGIFESVSVTTRPAFAFGNATPVPRTFLGGPPAARRLHDMMPDGRFLGLIIPGQASADNPGNEFNLVLNWFEELKARIPR